MLASFKYNLYLICQIFLATTCCVFAQSRRSNQVYFQIDGLATANRQVPFWLRANQFGIVPKNGSAALLKAGISWDYINTSNDSIHSYNRKLDWGMSVEGVHVVNKKNRFILPEVYAKIKYGKLELWAGRRKEFIGITDTTLTSGSIVWSNNALPVPKIQIGTIGFVPIKFLHNFVALKGSLAHGWFNVPYIQGVYLHYKSLHARIGKPTGSFKLYFGINHMVQWGGYADYLKGSPFAVNGHLTTAPQDFFWGVLLGRSSKERQNDRFTGFDGENRIGNHIGNYDVALRVKAANHSLLLYHQRLFEDLSGLLFLNRFDGLYGLSWNFPHTSTHVFQHKKIVLEFLTTTNQAGSTFDITARFQGGDNYFNHSQYVQGWSYYDRSIGTPLLPLRTELNMDQLPRSEFIFPINRVNAVHLASEGVLLSKIQILLRCTYSLNYGTFAYPFPNIPKQFSSSLSIKNTPHWLNGFIMEGKVAYDNGAIYASNIGLYLSLIKNIK